MCYLAMAEEWGLDKSDQALNQISTHEQVCEQNKVSNRLWWIMGLIVVSIIVPQFI